VTVNIGANNVSGGTLQFGNTFYTAAGAIGTTTGFVFANQLNLGGAVSGNYSSGLINAQGANNISGGVALIQSNANIAVTGGSLLISGQITDGPNGAGGFNLTSGTLTVNGGNNSYSGNTTLTGGTLVAANNNAFANSTLVFNGSTLAASVVAPQTMITLNKNMTFGATTPSVTLSQATPFTLNGTLTVPATGTSSIVGSTNTALANNADFAGQITGGGPGSTLSLTGYFTIAGGAGSNVQGNVQFNPGTSVNIQDSDAVGTTGFNGGGVGTSTLVFNGGGFANTSGTPYATGGFIGPVVNNYTFGATPGAYFNGNTAIEMSGAGNLSSGADSIVTNAAGACPLTLSGPLTGTGSATFYLGAPALVSGVISGSESIIESGPGSLTLSGTNTYTGNVTVTAGSLYLTNSSSLGVGPKTVTNTNGTAAAGTDQIHLNGSAGAITLASNISFVTSNNFNSASAAIVNDAGNNVINGTITMAAGGGGTPLLVGAGSLTVNGAVSSNTTGRVLYLRGSGSGLINGVISDGTGATGLAMDNGIGTWTLTGANTYSQGTTLSAGTLRVNNTAGSGTGTGVVTVAVGGTLGGSGNVSGGVVVSGTITGGPDAVTTGNLSTGAQTWNAGGTYLDKFSADGTTHDELIMSGLTVASNASSPFTVAVTSTGTPTLGTTPYILANDSDINASSNPFATPAVLAQLTLTVTGVQPTLSNGSAVALGVEADPGGNGYDLVLEAAPEPTSLLLLGLTGAPLALGRRRRRRTTTVTARS
jgi:fibronectin-binding autotransporter adhesin